MISRWFRRQFRKFSHFVQDFLEFRWLSLRWWVGGTIGMGQWFRQSWRAGNLRNGLLALPSLIVLGLVIYVFLQARTSSRKTAESYWQAANTAIKNEQPDAAKIYLRRVLSTNSDFENEALFALATILEESGEVERAQGLFRRLAPDDKIGAPGAHRRVAIRLADRLTVKNSANDLRRLKWHLDAAGKDRSPELALSWGRYHALNGDVEAALKSFHSVAKRYPELYQIIGELETHQQNYDAARDAYSHARTFFATKLVKTDTSAEDQINYAKVLMRLGQFQDAQVVLETAKQQYGNSDVKWDTLIATLLVNFHDLLAAKGEQIPRLLETLSEALTKDPNHNAALTRLMAYSRAKVEGDIDLKKILAKAIAEGDAPGMSHLAMGNLCMLRGEEREARFHYRRALELQDQSPVIMNNMAWVLAHQEPPELEQALILANSAVEKRPEDPNLLDTRGTIYLKQGEWKLALNDLEKALKTIDSAKPVHEKLSQIYTRLGLEEIASEHQSLSK